ncbi:MAG: peptide ABC transporter substrate-binding protein [bacterium]|nr:peptide ABC transporter substrate-binding protein [bacterium]
MLGLLLVAMIISGSGLFIRLYAGLTKPVPGIGGSYTEGFTKEPRTINPIYSSQDTDRDISRLVFSRLFYYDHTGELKPDLAEKYEMSKDGKNYKVILRSGVKWHDGKPLTAGDIVFTIQTIQNPQYKSVLRANWLGVQVEKIDDKTVNFSLRVPYTHFAENLTLGIIPKHLWEKIPPEQALLHELNLKPVGSGPYRFNKLKQDKNGSVLSYKLSRNSRYYRNGPYLGEINFIFFKSEEEIIAALHKNLIDGFGPLSKKYLENFDQQKVSVFSLGMPRIFGLFFNQKENEILKEKAVREAIAYAINKKDLADKATSGGAVVADSPLPFGSKSSAQNLYSYNPETAKQILEKAQWLAPDSGGTRVKKPKGKKELQQLKFKLVTSDWPDLIRTAEIIQKNLKDVGIEITIESRPLSELEQLVIKPREFEILLFGQVYGFEADPFSFWHSSQIKDPGLNVSLYSNKKADKIMEDLRKLNDPAVRNKKYEDLASILKGDLPAVFLYNQLYIYLLPANLRGVDLGRISLPSDRFNEISKWYVDTERVWSW